MDEQERNRIARRIAEIDVELNRLATESRNRIEDPAPAPGLQDAIAGLSSSEVAPAMLAHLRRHFQIIATELLTRQAQCERLAEEAAEAAHLIARLEQDRG